MWCGPQQKTPVGQTYGQICLNISRMRSSLHWNNCQTMVRMFFLRPCWYLSPCNSSPTHWSPTHSIQLSSRSTYSASLCARQRHQIAGAQLAFPPVPLTPLPHPTVCAGEYLDWVIPPGLSHFYNVMHEFTEHVYSACFIVSIYFNRCALSSSFFLRETVEFIETCWKQCYAKYLKILPLMSPLHSTSE